MLVNLGSNYINVGFYLKLRTKQSTETSMTAENIIFVLKASVTRGVQNFSCISSSI